MNGELTTPASLIVHPVTGEARELATLEAGELRDGIEQMQALASAVRDATRQLAEEAMRRKNAGEPVAGVEVSRSNSWRAGDTGAALDKLERDGLLPTERDHYLQPTESLKPIGRNLTALLDALVAAGEVEAAQVLMTARTQSVKAKVSHG